MINNSSALFLLIMNRILIGDRADLISHGGEDKLSLLQICEREAISPLKDLVPQ